VGKDQRELTALSATQKRSEWACVESVHLSKASLSQNRSEATVWELTAKSSSCSSSSYDSCPLRKCMNLSLQEFLLSSMQFSIGKII